MADVRPVRLQLSRRKGFDLQALSRATNGLPAVNCARPGKWGNPFSIGMTEHCGVPFAEPLTRKRAIELHRGAIECQLRDFPRALEELRGKNLACFCGLHEPCHVDTYLDLANRQICEEVTP
jgi:hypothetical protein